MCGPPVVWLCLPFQPRLNTCLTMLQASWVAVALLWMHFLPCFHILAYALYSAYHMLFFVIIITDYCISFKTEITFYLHESLLSLPKVKQGAPVGPLCISFIRFITLKSDYFPISLSLLLDCKQFWGQDCVLIICHFHSAWCRAEHNK